VLHGGTVSPRPASGGVAGVGFRLLHSGSAEQRAFDLPDPSGTGIYQDRCASWPGSPCASAVWPGRVSLNGCKGIYQQESFLNATASGEIYRLTCQMSAIGVYGKVGRTPRYKREGIGAWLRSRSRSCRWGYPYVRQGLGSGSLTGSEYRQRKTQQGRRLRSAQPRRRSMRTRSPVPSA